MRTPEEIARAIALLQYALPLLPEKEAREVAAALGILRWVMMQDGPNNNSFGTLLDRFEKRQRAIEDALRAQNN